jgi:hypothetical protein
LSTAVLAAVAVTLTIAPAGNSRLQVPLASAPPVEPAIEQVIPPTLDVTVPLAELLPEPMVRR